MAILYITKKEFAYSILIAEQYSLSGLAALRLSTEAFPTESLSVIDGNFQWSDRAFEVILY